MIQFAPVTTSWNSNDLLRPNYPTKLHTKYLYGFWIDTRYLLKATIK